MKTLLLLTRRSRRLLIGLGLTGIAFNLSAAACSKNLTLTQKHEANGQAAYYFTDVTQGDRTRSLASHSNKAGTVKPWPYQQCAWMTALAPSCDPRLYQY